MSVMRQNGIIFYGVCVNTCYVYLATHELKNHSAKVIATVGFPLGANATKSKIQEAKQAIKDGADEIDMVINLGYLKSHLTKSVSEEIRAVKKAIGRRVLKVIIETGYLSQGEMKLACEIIRLAGGDFCKNIYWIRIAWCYHKGYNYFKESLG